MKIAREVILDLLPVYLAGEASPATRALIAEYIREDPELAQRIEALSAESAPGVNPPRLSPDLELRALRRMRAVMGWQKWLFALAITFTALSLTSELSFEGGRLTEFHFLIRDYPAQFGSFAGLAVICWVGYYALRRRLRTNDPS